MQFTLTDTWTKCRQTVPRCRQSAIACDRLLWLLIKGQNNYVIYAAQAEQCLRRMWIKMANKRRWQYLRSSQHDVLPGKSGNRDLAFTPPKCCGKSEFGVGSRKNKRARRQPTTTLTTAASGYNGWLPTMSQSSFTPSFCAIPCVYTAALLPMIANIKI